MATVDTAVNIAVIELLVQPEYGNDWLTEILESQGVEVTDEVLNQVNDTIYAALKTLAKPFIEALPEDLRKAYQK